MKTKYGLTYNLATSIDPSFEGYDRTLAEIHLRRFNCVILDEFNKPLDNEFDLEQIEKQIHQ